MLGFLGYVNWNVEEKIILNSDLTYTKYINDTSYKVLMSGEIYNIDILSTEIKNKDVKIQLGIFEEILLLGYIIWNFDIINRAYGNYICVIWNERKKELIFLRDSSKKVPMFYSIYENGIFFSTSKNNLTKIPFLKEIEEMKSEKYVIYNRQGLYKVI